MTKDQLREAIVNLCQLYGYTNATTYELIDSVIDSIHEDPEEDDDEPMDMSGSTPGAER